MFNKLITLTLFFLFIFSPLTTKAEPTTKPAKPTIKIGVSAPLTGDNAHIGEGLRDALIFAKEDLSEDTKYNYEFVFEDDGLQARRAASAANKLINIDKVDALVSVSSGTGGAISPIANRNKVLHFGIASERSVADGEYNFIHWTPPLEQARLMSKELNRRGVKRLAIMTLNHPGTLSPLNALKASLEGTSVEIVSSETINPGERDFRSILAKSRRTNPEVYLLMLLTPELEIATRQIREAGIDIPLTAIESFSLSSNPELFEGSWYVDAAEAEKGFYTRFQARFNKGPSLGAPNAYDIFNLIVHGYENTPVSDDNKKPEMRRVVDTLHQVKDMSAMMGKLTIDKQGIVFSPASVKIIKNGKPEALAYNMN
jgi:branched-chain amino acid transport system substrate-binding protein